MDEPMKFLFLVTAPDAARILVPLVRACRRQGAPWACFLTHDGVRVLERDDVRAIITDAIRAVACEYSWERFMGTQACPVELGSQTDHSIMVGEAARIVSL
ncbi:MAG TPA: hypothetical protein DEP05_02335 [Betaproteobacteria bacterium]|nr:hypothetical protein [Betaproteobacteria bacterium]